MQKRIKQRHTRAYGGGDRDRDRDHGDGGAPLALPLERF